MQLGKCCQEGSKSRCHESTGRGSYSALGNHWIILERYKGHPDTEGHMLSRKLIDEGNVFLDLEICLFAYQIHTQILLGMGLF